MDRRLLILVLITIIIISSCSYPGTPENIPSPRPTLAASTAAIVMTPSPIPLETLLAAAELPTATSTSTPSMTLAWPREQPVNCRFGPDISYAVIGALNIGRQAEVIGKNIDITWLYVRNPSDPSTSCWLSVDFINVAGDVALLPVVGPPEIMVTGIRVSIEPPTMNVACDAFPQSVMLSAEITTNGPSIVTWFWKSNTGQTSAQKQILFEAGSAKVVQDVYRVDRAGDYSIRVQTEVPNTAVGEATFKVICIP